MKRKGFFGTGNAKAMVVLFFAALSLGSCAKKQEEKQFDTLAVVLPANAIGVPIVYLAKEKGYFEEEGLKPDFVTVTATNTIEPLSIGKVDVTLQGIIPGLSYAAQGADVKVFAGTASGGNYIFCRPENAEKYQDLANWDGIKFGTIRLSTSEVVTRSSLSKLGVKDVTYVEIDQMPNIVEAVRKGSVDIGSVPAEFSQSLKDLGLTTLFPMTTLAPEYVCCREVAYSKALETKRGAFVKFVAAQLRAYKDLKQNPDETIRILAKASSQSEDFVRDVIYNLGTNGDRSFNPDPNLNGVRDVYQTLKDLDYIEKRGIEVPDIVDITIYKDALDDIIKRFPDDPIYRELAAVYQVNNL
ncbi:MAG: ABC transporter substrate-binding protein [Treponema sp.]|jgi:NitT/TauT family transport system substrate-binding protein|nr:ABC transporter substrate-binding protein [Treponema sp.]